jgi:HSP20 family protein
MNFVVRNHNGFPVPFAFRRTPVNGSAASFDRLFDNVLEDFFAAPKTPASNDSVTPRTHVSEDDQTYIVEAEIPGVTKENVKISVEGNVVTLEAEVKRQVEQKDGDNVTHTERTVRKFARRFTLAKDVDDTQSVAKLENGILTLTLPKKAELRPKQITVQ